MMGWQKAEMEQLNNDLKHGQVVSIHKAYKNYTSPDGRFTKWRLIVETMNGLEWLYTWSPELAAKEGTVSVVFYKDNKGDRCIKRPNKG